MVNATLAENATSAPPMLLPLAGSGPSILTSLGYFCLLLGVIYLAYYFMKRFGLQGMGMGGGPNSPRLIGRLMVGSRQSLAVVRFRGKDLLLGVTEERITRLDEFEVEDDEPEATKPRHFSAFLKRGKGDEE